MNIPKHKKVLNRTAGGTTTINTSVVDSAGYDRIKFVGSIGDIAASGACVVKLQQGSLANGSDMADVKGSGVSLADGADENVVVIHDVIRPQQRYLRQVFVRSGGNVELDSVIVELSEGINQPEALDSTIKAYKQMGSPDLGTA